MLKFRGGILLSFGSLWSVLGEKEEKAVHAVEDMGTDCVLHVSVPGVIQTVQPLAHSNQSEATTSSAGRVGQSHHRKWKICWILFWMFLRFLSSRGAKFHKSVTFLYVLSLFILILVERQLTITGLSEYIKRFAALLSLNPVLHVNKPEISLESHSFLSDTYH